jgi:hypothetical protein
MLVQFHGKDLGENTTRRTNMLAIILCKKIQLIEGTQIM